MEIPDSPVQRDYQAWRDSPRSPPDAEAILWRLENVIADRSFRAAQRCSLVEAADLMQEARIALVEALPRYDPARSRFLTYALAVIEGSIKAAVSEACRRPEPQDVAFCRDLIAETETRVAMGQALTKLPIRHFEVIKRRFYQNQTQVEVANALSISQARVSQIEAEAHSLLRDLLTADD